MSIKIFDVDGKPLSNQYHRRLVLRWASLRGLTAIILFFAAAALLEYVIVMYAVNLGVKEETPFSWSFKFPITNQISTLTISPLFHLVPAAVILALTSSWICLTRYIALSIQKASGERVKAVKRAGVKMQKKGIITSRIGFRIKAFLTALKTRLLKSKGVAFFWSKVSFAKATIKSAFIILVAFFALTLAVSFIAYPKLIYNTLSNFYIYNPSLLSFVKTFKNTAIGWFCSAFNNAILNVAHVFRNVSLSLGNLFKPIVELSPSCKYLLFQNVAAWVSAFSILLYGAIVRRGYGPKRVKKVRGNRYG